MELRSQIPYHLSFRTETNLVPKKGEKSWERGCTEIKRNGFSHLAYPISLYEPLYSRPKIKTYISFWTPAVHVEKPCGVLKRE